jgi:hypothetical protein
MHAWLSSLALGFALFRAQISSEHIVVRDGRKDAASTLTPMDQLHIRESLRAAWVCLATLRYPMSRHSRRETMDGPSRNQKGGIGYIVAWLLGVPIPILILVALLRGCT